MSFLHIIALFVTLGLLSGCTTYSTTSIEQRDAYLQKFLGESSQHIQANLHLSELGYQQVHPPIVDSNSITYTVMRPVTIPVPMAQTGPGAVPIQVTPRAESYDVNLQCKIIYRLEHNIAKSVYYTGRTC